LLIFLEAILNEEQKQKFDVIIASEGILKHSHKFKKEAYLKIIVENYETMTFLDFLELFMSVISLNLNLIKI
jgi:hypothetical protein